MEAGNGGRQGLVAEADKLSNPKKEAGAGDADSSGEVAGVGYIGSLVCNHMVQALLMTAVCSWDCPL